MNGGWINHVDSPMDGATNMAIDQVLLQSAANNGGSSLRFYRWSEPTLSLGYFQYVQCRAEHSPSEPITMVRRSTGGGAIIHDRELTYSLCVTGHRRTGADANVYDAMHQAIISALGDFDIGATSFRCSSGLNHGDPKAFLCFERRTPDDLVLSGFKIVGSAQRRAASAVLQHGSILLQSSPHAPSLPGVFDLVNQRFEEAELIDRIINHLSASIDLSSAKTKLSPQEKGQVKEIAENRFQSQSWNLRR